MSVSRIIFFSSVSAAAIWAAAFGAVRGVVHGPDHRPVPGAVVSIKSVTSDFEQQATTDADGTFVATSLPVGVYRLTVNKEGFAAAVQSALVETGSAPVLHFQLALAATREQVNVSESTQ